MVNPFPRIFVPTHPMAIMASMPDHFLMLLGLRPQAIHHQRRQIRSRAAHAMRRDGLTINQIADQLNLSPTTISGYFAAP